MSQTHAPPKPIQYEYNKPYKMLSKGFFNGASVTFEGDILLRNLTNEHASQCAALLNGAYNMGRYHEKLYGK